jgi:hypothetical protein
MGEVQPRLSPPGLPPLPLTLMVTNPWINRITALVVLLAVYAAGYAGGRDAATMARLNHPACHGNLIWMASENFWATFKLQKMPRWAGGSKPICTFKNFSIINSEP